MLTDEQIESLWRSIHHGKHMATGFNTFARAIEKAVREEMAKQGPATWFIDVTTDGKSEGRYEVAAKEYWGEDFTIPLYAAPVVPDGMVMVPKWLYDGISADADKWREANNDNWVPAAEKQNARS